MSDINLGRVGFVPKGQHSPGASYDILDTVVYAKNGYCCIKPIPANSGILPTNPEYYQLLVEKGDPGIQGPGGTGPKGDTFTYDMLTTEQLEDLRSGISAFNVRVRDTEVKIGTIRLFNLDYDLFRMIVDIQNIPTTLNDEATFTLSAIPLGFNLYLKTDSLVVAQEAGPATSDFFNDSYKISRLFVDSDLCTKVTIKCIQAVTETVKASIQVEYVKDFGETLELNVSVPVGINPENVNLTFPKLKYNKKNVATFLIEDSASCWNLFSAMNKKWVDNEKLSFFITGDDRRFFFHKDFSYEKNGTIYNKSTGVYPSKPYEYTDGAGVKHRYAMQVDTWAWMITQNTNGWGWSVVNADELLFMQDFGLSCMLHDIKGVADIPEAQQSAITQAQFNAFVDTDEETLKSFTNRYAKGGSTAAGNPVYLKYIGHPKMHFLLSTNAPAGAVPFKPFAEGSTPEASVNRIQIGAFAGGYDLTAFKNDILAGDALPLEDRVFNILAIDYVYAIDSGYLAFFADIDAALGEAGDDSLLFTSIDEVYEYWFITKYAKFYKTIDGQNIKFKIHAPCNHNFFFKSISCLLGGIEDTTGVVVSSSENCNGTSYGISDSKLLVNMDFNSDLIAKVEKYLTIFEADPTKEYAYDDASYFIQQLKPGVIEPYQARLEAFVSPPTLSAVSINAGASTTSSQLVTVALSIAGSATQMMLSEDPNFAGASWVPYSASSTFSLSAGFSAKTIYVQLKNSFGESEVGSDSITYVDIPLALSAISINGGAAVTGSRDVVVSFTYEGAPTHYMLSESPDFTGASWIAFEENPSFNLSDTNAVKTIFAKLQNATTTTGTLNDTIQYTYAESVALTSISLDDGAATTNDTVVSVVLVYTGTPTQYRISESSTFVGASWLTFTGSPVNFTLSSTPGTKTVYAQVQNSVSVSTVRNDAITLNAPAQAAVISLSYGYANGDLIYTVLGGTTFNVTTPSPVASNPPKQLKDKTGTLVPWYWELNSSLFAANSETSATNSMLGGADCGSPADTGPYPGSMLSGNYLTYGNTSDTLKARVLLTLPTGTYRIKIINHTGWQSTKAPYLPYCFYKVNVNGVSGTPVQAGPDGFDSETNLDFNAELNFTVGAGDTGTANVALYLWNTYPGGLNGRPGINLFEIQKLS
jgi:hypothetical protein